MTENSNETLDIYSGQVEADLNIVLIENPVVLQPNQTFDNLIDFKSRWTERSYSLNLFKVKCNCADFEKIRYKYDKIDPRRYCKHLFQHSFERSLLASCDPLSFCIMESGWSGPFFSTLRVNNASRLSFIYGENDWINVFVRNRNSGDKYGEYSGAYRNYGYSITDRRWSYGIAPPGSIMIKELMKYNNLI